MLRPAPEDCSRGAATLTKPRRESASAAAQSPGERIRAEVGPAEVGPAEVGRAEVGRAEVGPGEVGPGSALAGEPFFVLRQHRR